MSLLSLITTFVLANALFNRPGAASIGLAVGQVGVGIGSAVGHSSMLSRALSKANIRLFVPNGLEIWYVLDVASL